MKKGWREVALGDVLTAVARFEDRSDLKNYQFAGTYSYARGIFRNELKPGSSFNLPSIQQIKAGDFIYCKIMAWEGAFGLAGDDVHDCWMSGAFVAFRPDTDSVLPKFLHYWFKAERNWRRVAASSTGTNVRRKSLHPDDFLKVRILLPPLGEQQRIVAHLDAIEARLTRAQKLREESALESLALIRSMMQPEHCHEVKPVPMHELVIWRSPDVAVSQSESYTFAGVYSFGRGVFKKEAVSGMDFAYDRLTRLCEGEFTFPKLMAWEGALGIVPPECDGCHVSPEFPVFTVDESKVLPEILDIHFKTPAVWKDLAAISTGTNLRRRRLNPNAFLGYYFPLPPMAVQQQVKAIAERAAAKRKLQSEAAVMEKALLPSLLDQIFNT